jgi:PAS domain S-box-containing protein
MKQEKLDDLYQILIERSLQGLVVYQDGGLVFVNDAAGKYLGIPADALTGYAFDDLMALVHPDERGEMEECIQSLLADHASEITFDLRILDGSGQYKWLECMATTVPFQGSPGVLVCFCDISNRKAAEERFRILFDQAPDSMFIYSLQDRKFLEVNEEFCNNLGYTLDELLQLEPDRVFTGKNGSSILKKIHSGRRKRKMIFETEYYRKNGTVFPAEISIQWIECNGAECALAVSRDITPRKKHERLLEESQQQYRELSIHLQNVREEQNALIAREIHDDLGQSLTALKMHLSLLEKHMDKANDNNAQELMTDMKSILDDTVYRVRKLSRDLWPSQLDISGIIEALEVQVAEFRQYSGIEVVFAPPVQDISLPKDRSLAVYRIVQEALTNVVRHANATRVTIDVYVEAGQLHVILKDNGKGIKIRKSDKNLTFGILSMKERAAMFKGSLTLSSSTGRGTILHLKMPPS